MTLLESTLRQIEFIDAPEPNSHWDGVRDSLELCFSTSFSILDIASGEVRFSGSIDPINELPNFAGLCAAVLERGRPEFIAEHDPVAVLAVPIVGCTGRYVAVAPFAIAEADDGTIAQSLTSLGYRTEDALAWSSSASVWNAKRLVHLAELQVEKWSADERMHRLHRENAELSSHLSATYEELSLLYGLTQKLKISASIEELGQKSLEWLAEAVAAEGLLLELLPHANSLDEAGSRRRANRCSCPWAIARSTVSAFTD